MLGGCSKSKPTDHELQILLTPIVWDDYILMTSLGGANPESFMMLKNTKRVNGYYESGSDLDYVAIVKADVIASKSYDQIMIEKSSIEFFDKYRPGIDKIVGKKFLAGELIATVQKKLFLRRGDMGWILKSHTNISEQL
ncbi:MAG: hypothetical protein QM504_04245 [Pseudomonadota bacterium]